MTRKALVRFDPARPKAASFDFLALVAGEDGSFSLTSVKTGNAARFGLVVYTGRTVTAEFIYARLTKSGQERQPLDEARGLLERFVEDVSSFKIGNVVELASDGSNRLTLYAASPRT